MHIIVEPQVEICRFQLHEGNVWHESRSFYPDTCLHVCLLFTFFNSHFETLRRDSILTTEKKQVVLRVSYSGSHSRIIAFDKVHRVGLLWQVALALWCSCWPEPQAPWNLPMRTVTAFYTKNICTGKIDKTLNTAVWILQHF